MRAVNSTYVRIGLMRASLLGGVAIATSVTSLAPLPVLAAGAVTTAPGGGNASGINYGAAQPMPMPMSSLAPPSLLESCWQAGVRDSYRAQRRIAREGR